MGGVFVFVGLVIDASDGECDFSSKLEMNSDTSACCLSDLMDVWSQSTVNDDCYS